MRPQDNTYRPDIDGLRALAVLAVVIFHAWPRRLPGGFVGVDVFFVISGYLISRIIANDLEKENFNLKLFYQKRIKRIFPALLIVLVSTTIISVFIFLPNEFTQLAHHLIAGTFFSSNFLLWRESGYFDVASDTKPFLHLWSLAIEEQFYLLWPIFLFSIWKKKSLRFFLIGIFLLISFFASVFALKTNPTAAFYSPIYRFWEILIGASYALYPYFNFKFKWESFFAKKIVKNAASIIGFLAILFAAKIYSKTSSFPGSLALIPSLGALLIIFAGAQSIINKYIFSNKYIIYIGLISYPLYLWHWPLLSFAHIYRLDGVLLPKYFELYLMIIALALSVFTYQFIELKLNTISLATLTKRLLPAMLIPVTLAGIIIYFDGIPARFFHHQASVKNIDEEIKVYSHEYREGLCFLKPDQTFNEFSQICHAQSVNSAIFLWGDSYSAHLYPGLKNYLPEIQNRISQFNASACPPILNYADETRPHCKSINDYVFSVIQKEKPHYLIMSAAWQTYYQKPDFTKNLKETLLKLDKLNIKIIFIGPALVQAIQPLRAIIRFNGKDKIRNEMYPELKKIDQILFDVAKEFKLEYVSPISKFCTRDTECLLTININGRQRLLSWDLGHMTRDGSLFFAQTFLQELKNL